MKQILPQEIIFLGDSLVNKRTPMCPLVLNMRIIPSVSHKTLAGEFLHCFCKKPLTHPGARGNRQGAYLVCTGTLYSSIWFYSFPKKLCFGTWVDFPLKTGKSSPASKEIRGYLLNLSDKNFFHKH